MCLLLLAIFLSLFPAVSAQKSFQKGWKQGVAAYDGSSAFNLPAPPMPGSPGGSCVFEQLSLSATILISCDTPADLLAGLDNVVVAPGVLTATIDGRVWSAGAPSSATRATSSTGSGVVSSASRRTSSQSGSATPTGAVPPRAEDIVPPRRTTTAPTRSSFRDLDPLAEAIGERRGERQLQSSANDPFASAALFDTIGAPVAWSTYELDSSSGVGLDPIVVAVFDTGVDYTHEDLKNVLWRNVEEVPGNGVDDDGNGHVDDVFGIDSVNDDGDPLEDTYSGHGTMVAGIIAAEGGNNLGVASIANWAVTQMPKKRIQLMPVVFYQHFSTSALPNITSTAQPYKNCQGPSIIVMEKFINENSRFRNRNPLLIHGEQHLLSYR